MSHPEQTVVELRERASRADEALVRALGISRREATRLFAEGRVHLAARALSKGDLLEAGSVVVVDATFDGWLRPDGAPTLEVLYDDDDLVAVCKPAGAHSHPLRRGEGGTTLDAIAAQFPECALGGTSRDGGLLHRLDQHTSGVLVCARSVDALARWRATFASGVVEKGYLALVAGPWEGSEPARVDEPLVHDATDARRMRVLADRPGRGAPQSATTWVTCLQTREAASLVSARLRVGRRHQVRVHLAWLGHPLVGDELYGGPAAEGLSGAALHASSVTLPGGQAIAAGPPATFLEAGRRLALSPAGSESG